MVQKFRLFHPKGKGMSALTFTADPRLRARALEAHMGGRDALARSLGCSPGTLENFHRDRLKEIKRGWLERKLEAFLARKIEAEIKRLTHELQTYRLAGGDVAGSAQIQRLAEAVEAAKALIANTSLRRGPEQ